MRFLKTSLQCYLRHCSGKEPRLTEHPPLIRFLNRSREAEPAHRGLAGPGGGGSRYCTRCRCGGSGGGPAGASSEARTAASLRCQRHRSQKGTHLRPLAKEGESLDTARGCAFEGQGLLMGLGGERLRDSTRPRCPIVRRPRRSTGGGPPGTADAFRTPQAHGSPTDIKTISRFFASDQSVLSVPWPSNCST